MISHHYEDQNGLEALTSQGLIQFQPIGDKVLCMFRTEKNSPLITNLFDLFDLDVRNYTDAEIAQQVRKAFRKITTTCHPDLAANNDPEEKAKDILSRTQQFQLLNASYEAIQDASVRAELRRQLQLFQQRHKVIPASNLITPSPSEQPENKPSPVHAVEPTTASALDTEEAQRNRELYTQIKSIKHIDDLIVYLQQHVTDFPSDRVTVGMWKAMDPNTPGSRRLESNHYLLKDFVEQLIQEKTKLDQDHQLTLPDFIKNSEWRFLVAPKTSTSTSLDQLIDLLPIWDSYFESQRSLIKRRYFELLNELDHSSNYRIIDWISVLSKFAFQDLKITVQYPVNADDSFLSNTLKQKGKTEIITIGDLLNKLEDAWNVIQNLTNTQFTPPALTQFPVALIPPPGMSYAQRIDLPSPQSEYNHVASAYVQLRRPTVSDDNFEAYVIKPLLELAQEGYSQFTETFSKEDVEHLISELREAAQTHDLNTFYEILHDIPVDAFDLQWKTFKAYRYRFSLGNAMRRAFPFQDGRELPQLPETIIKRLPAVWGTSNGGVPQLVRLLIQR